MPRKLKVYQTSLDFYDLVIATPSMKAALEAWGAASNLFHQGFAKEVADKAIVDAALDKPGIVLRRSGSAKSQDALVVKQTFHGFETYGQPIANDQHCTWQDDNAVVAGRFFLGSILTF